MMKRREFFAGAAVTLINGGAKATSSINDIPIIDTHIHLFDARRPQGAPYVGSVDYRGGVALPATFRELAEPLNIVGAVAVEASPWIEDNLWVLEQEATDTFMVGMIGNLEPEKPEFAEYLDRYGKNPLFLGIRCGNSWGRDIAKQVDTPPFIEGLKRVAEAGMVMDSANPRVNLLQAIVKLNDRVPDLRIVIDHLPSLDPTPEMQRDYDAVLREIEGRPNIYTKLSEIDHRGQKEAGLAAHKGRLDMLFGIFGEDRVIFGSDWPNSWGVASPTDIVRIARAYFATRGFAAAEKFFWKNSLKAYKWVKRAVNQPSFT